MIHTPVSVRSAHPIGGIVCPIATPIEEGRFRADIFSRHVSWLMNQCDGLFVLGSSGELAALPTKVRADVLHATDHVPLGLPVFVGVGEASTARVIEQLDNVPERADFVVAPGPYYFAATSQQALIDHFAAVADRAPRPVVLYNLPQNTVVPIAPGTLRQLAQHPNIVAIKDSAGDMFAFSEFLRVVPPGFAILQGREQLAASSLWLGAAGLISSLSNFAPHYLRRLVDAVQANRRDEATRLQSEIADLARVFDQGHWVAALKATLSELGLPAGVPIPPLEPCTEPQREEIKRLLGRHDLPQIAA